MSNVKPVKLKLISDNLLAHWCPACDGCHLIYINKLNHFSEVWEWNLDMDKPTFTPSLGVPNHCHYRITDGNIEFLPDSKHILAGKTVSMPDIPDLLHRAIQVLPCDLLTR